MPILEASLACESVHALEPLSDPQPFPVSSAALPLSLPILRPKLRAGLVLRHARAKHARIVARGVVIELASENGEQAEHHSPAGVVRTLEADTLAIDAVGPVFQAWQDLFQALDSFGGLYRAVQTARIGG